MFTITTNATKTTITTKTTMSTVTCRQQGQQFSLIESDLVT